MIIIVLMTKNLTFQNETANQLNDTVRLLQTEMKDYEHSRKSRMNAMQIPGSE